MKTFRDIKSAAYMDAVIGYAEKLLGIRFRSVKKNRYDSPCPFHVDTDAGFIAYVDKKDEVRFHCFGICKGDWDIYDLIMLRKKCGFETAKRIWAEHLRIVELSPDADGSPRIPEPDETPEPDDSVVFVQPEKPDEKVSSAFEDVAGFYNELLMSKGERFRHIRDYLAFRGVGKDLIERFNIGFAPPYNDAQYRGRALIDGFLPRFESGALADIGLVTFLNDGAVKGYGYYCRQIDFTRENPFSRNYGDFLAGRIVFPIYDADARPVGFMGRRPDDGGIRRLKRQNREIALPGGSRLYGIEKAAGYIRQYRTVLLVEGIFDYFAFYDLLRDKPMVISVLGSYLALEAADLLKELDIEHFIVAYDWDATGRNGIERIAVKSGAWVHYLGGLAEGLDPYDLLKPLVGVIPGFFPKPLLT